MLTSYLFLLFVVVVAVIDGGVDYSDRSQGRNDNDNHNNNTYSYSPLNPSTSLVLDRKQQRIQQVRKQHNGKQQYDNSNNNNRQKQKQRQGRQHNNSTTTTSMRMRMMLNMTLCGDKCDTQDCKSYSTPLNICYNSSVLFPQDPSWSGKDIYDAIMFRQNTLIRKIYDTENGTCRHNNNNTFLIPLNACVGPFGLPRPWGMFRLIHA